MIKDIRGIGHVVVDSVLGGGLGPIAATLVFGAGDKADAIALEEARILLLGDGLGESARFGRSEKVRQKEFAEPRSFISEVDLARIAERVVAVGQEKVG